MEVVHGRVGNEIEKKREKERWRVGRFGGRIVKSRSFPTRRSRVVVERLSEEGEREGSWSAVEKLGGRKRRVNIVSWPCIRRALSRS